MSLEKIAEAVEKIANSGIGTLVGAVRKKDKGESRSDAIARSTGTDTLTSAGIGAGTTVGGVAGGLSHKEVREGLRTLHKGGHPSFSSSAAKSSAIRRIGVGTGAGAVLGGLAAYNTFKRKKKDD